MNEHGVVPDRKYRYQWIGDQHLDKERSDLVRWYETGEGLVALEGTELTEYVWEPLDPSCLDGIHAQLAADTIAEPSPYPTDGRIETMTGLPALRKLAVAHGLVEVKHGTPLKRIRGTNGPRVDPTQLAALDYTKAVWLNGERLRLVPHLGLLILNASYPTEPEGKV